MALNVNDAAQTEQVLNAIRQNFGDISILVNNAGITKDNLLARMTDEEWDDVLTTNLKSVFRLSRAVLRRDDEGPRRPHHQHLLGGRQHGQPGPGQLRRLQGRHGRFHQVARAGDRQPQHHRELRRAPASSTPT